MFAVVVLPVYEEPEDQQSSPFHLNNASPFSWSWLSTVNRVNSQVQKVRENEGQIGCAQVLTIDYSDIDFDVRYYPCKFEGPFQRAFITGVLVALYCPGCSITKVYSCSDARLSKHFANRQSTRGIAHILLLHVLCTYNHATIEHNDMTPASCTYLTAHKPKGNQKVNTRKKPEV